MLLQWAEAVAAAAAAKELEAAAYVSIRQRMSQHTSAYELEASAEESASIRQHTSAHESAYVSIRQHTSAANEQDFTSAKVQILTPECYKSCAKTSSTDRPT